MRIIDGQSLRAADGAPIAKPNVLVQYRQVSADRSDVDVNGNLSMYTHTIGKGRVVLFRNGKHLVGTWSRASNGAPTVLKDAAGKPLLLAPGHLCRAGARWLTGLRGCGSACRHPGLQPLTPRPGEAPDSSVGRVYGHGSDLVPPGMSDVTSDRPHYRIYAGHRQRLAGVRPRG